MQRFSIEVNKYITTVQRVADDIPEKIVNAGSYYFEIGEFENIEEANDRALEIKSLMVKLYQET